MSKKSNFVLGVVSTVLISIGSITALNTLSNPYVGIGVAVCGVIGLAIREQMKK